MKNLIIMSLISLSFSVAAQETIDYEYWSKISTYTVLNDNGSFPADPGTKVYKSSENVGSEYNPQIVNTHLYRKNNRWYGSTDGYIHNVNYKVSIGESNTTKIPCNLIWQTLIFGTEDPNPNLQLRVGIVVNGECEDEPINNWVFGNESHPNYLTLPSTLPHNVPENPSNGSMYYDPVSGKIKVFLLGEWKVIVTTEDDDD